jgi:MFS family permease
MTGRRGGLLRERDFRLFWAGESISAVGSSVTLVVMPLVAIDTLHTSTFIVTLLTAMVWLPWVIVGVPAGAWVDRLPPRPVMLASDAISVAVYASVPVAAWCGVLTVAQLIAVTLVAGAASVFFNSAYRVLLPGVVDEADLTEGNAKLLGSREVAQIGGRAARSGSRPRDRAAGRRGELRRLVLLPDRHAATAGSPVGWPRFRWRARRSSLRLAGSLPARDDGVLGALVARPLGRRFGTARAVIIAVPGGLCFALLLPLADKGPWLAFASVAMICAGSVIVIANVIVDSFIQTYVPPDILGRVISATWAVGFAMMPVGALLAGALATALGVRAALWILTALIAVSGLTFLLTPMRHLRDLPRRPAEVSVPASPGSRP